MELNGQFRAPAAPCTHWTGGCVAQEPVWMRWRRENSQPLPGLEVPTSQLVAQRSSSNSFIKVLATVRKDANYRHALKRILLS